MALPGVTTVLQDRFYSLSRANVPTGPRVCAIASRATVSGTGGVVDYDPYSASDEQAVVAAYGYGSQLHRAYLELVAGGASDIVLVALPSTTTDASLLSVATGNVFDTAFSAAESAQPDIIVPWGRGGHPADWTAPGATPGSWEATPSTPPQFGFYADSSSSAASSMALRVAQAVSAITSRGTPCFGVLGVKPYLGSGAFAMENVIASELANYVLFPNMPSNADTAMGGYGPYLSVVAAEMRPVTYPLNKTTGIFDWGYANGACHYAAQTSTLASYVSPTGQNLSNVSALRWTPTRTQQDVNISRRGMVPLGINYNRVPAWVDATTFAAPASDYARLTTLRIVFDAVQLTRQIAEQYVGQAATLQHKNAFETSISAGLRGMITLGAVNSADFSVSYMPAQNSAEVDLVLTPAFEMRSIIITVSVNF